VTTHLTSPIEKLKYLDGLRGILAVIVALHHAFGNFTGWHSGFYSIKNAVYCVDIFFILSGIVLYHNYHEAISLKMISLKDFFLIRMFRLYPMHIFCFLLVPFFFSLSIGQPYPDWIGKVTPLELFGDLTLLNALGLGFHVLTNGPAWSVSVELFAGTLIAWFSCLHQKCSLLLMIAAIIIICFINFDPTGITNPAIPFMTSGVIRCLFCMSAGIFFYRVLCEKRIKFIRNIKITNTIMITGLIAMPIIIIHLHLSILSWTAFSLYCAMTINLLPSSSFPVLAFLETPFFKWLGARSFSLYLLHTPVIFLLIRMQTDDTKHNILLAWAAIFIALMLSEFTSKFIEKPFTRFGHKFKS